MLMHKTGIPVPTYVDVINARGNTDYVQNGEVCKNASMQMVLVSGNQDLNLLSGYEPGTIAYTAGLQTMWQKSPTGTWVEF